MQLEKISIKNEVSISSRDIAKHTNKKHSHVKRDIEVSLKKDVSKFGRIYLDNMNRQQTEYMLPKNIALGIVSGYSFELRMRIINRLEELENKNKVSLPTSYKEALLALVAKEEELEKAIETKAWISDKKTATAMNTASQAVKKANALEIELDKSKEYCTIKRMSMLTHGQSFNWRLLKNATIEMECDTVDVFDSNYGTVKAYHRDVWLEVYGLEF